MKFIFFLFGISLLTLASCSNRQEQARKLKETQLKQKEQELLQKEIALQLKEEELIKREEALDSTAAINSVDTLLALHPGLTGMWNVTMRCTETTCPGSAVGDTKTEQWQISIKNNIITANAMSDKKLVRIYSGSYIDNSFELNAITDDVSPSGVAKMVVRLQPPKGETMTGQREILRPNDCRILYSLELEKQ